MSVWLCTGAAVNKKATEEGGERERERAGSGSGGAGHGDLAACVCMQKLQQKEIWGQEIFWGVKV